MRLRNICLKWFCVSCGVLFVAIACLAALVQIEQGVLRWRAGRLLADIRAVQMGKSTWVDAQRLMYRWGEWGRWVGACNANQCEYQITLQDSLHALPKYFWTDSGMKEHSEGHKYSLWQLRLYSILGGRVAQVYAYVRVKDGIVWRKSYSVYTPRHFFTDGLADFLIGDAEGTTRFTPRHDWPLLVKHPEYSIEAAGPCDGCRDGACTICEMIQMHFTPFVDPGVVNDLFDINLNCISSWHECREPREIAPAAWRLYTREREEQERTNGPGNSHDWKRCDTPIEMLGRDYRFALLAEVASIKESPDSDLTRYVVYLRGIKSLKNRVEFKAGILREPLVGWSDTVLPGGVHMSEIRPGSRFILLFDEPLGERDDVPRGGEFCTYVPDTDANRAAIRRGTERDKFADAQ